LCGIAKGNSATRRVITLMVCEPVQSFSTAIINNYMKLKDVRKANQDNEHLIFAIEIGIQEVYLIFSMVKEALKYTPKTIETTSVRGRLSNIDKCFAKILTEYKKN